MSSDSVPVGDLSGYILPKSAYRYLDEYVDRPEDEARGCPKGGLSCRCGWPNAMAEPD